MRYYFFERFVNHKIKFFFNKKKFLILFARFQSVKNTIYLLNNTLLSIINRYKTFFILIIDKTLTDNFHKINNIGAINGGGFIEYESCRCQKYKHVRTLPSVWISFSRGVVNSLWPPIKSPLSWWFNYTTVIQIHP